MRLILLAAAAAAAATLLATACSTTPPTPTLSTAKIALANLASSSGSLVSGKVTLVPMGAGVHLTGTVGGLPPNSIHGFHVHEKGDCSAVDASSAGAHFNPLDSKHGRASASAHHAGDLDNLSSNARGVATVDVHMKGVTLGGGAINDIAGRALVVHAVADDYISQPTGNAGARVACGVIRATP